MRSLLATFAFLFMFGFHVSDAQNSTPNAGSYTHARREVSTRNVEAQAAFDNGLTLLYAFNPESARVAFEHAAAADPTLAIAWWGVAMSYGVNINTDYDAAKQRLGRAAVGRARALEEHASPTERALIAAATERFTYVGNNDGDRSARAYRDAMNEAANAFPQDDDLAALAAEAEMDVHPWSYFIADGAPAEGTAGVIARLKTVLGRSPQHLQANHLLIHVYEESRQPEQALPAALRLTAMNFEPAAEHLAHMPAHTLMRVGAYHDAGEANARAVALYRTFLASNPPGHADYFAHDCAFGTDAFMMSGEFAAAQRIAAVCDGSGYRFAARIDLRFARYTELASLDEQDDFIAGMLAVHAQRYEAASKHLQQLRALTGSVPSIEADVLAARLSARQGNASGEIAALQRAVATQDASGYSEPPAFWYPVRETLGSAFYRAARYPEAEATFRQDLSRDAEDPRALYGLAETLDREGRSSEATPVRARFETAWAKADAPLDLNEY